ncbi:MAG TPA: radical SAM protein [bacterium]|nr:radical SAM protein [bacterium]
MKRKTDSRYCDIPPHAEDDKKKHIEISLGMACNNQCIFCLNVGPRKIVPFDQVRGEAEKYAASGFNSIGLIGGDPTVYPRIAELGRLLKALGYKHIHMITNGRRFSKMEFLDEMIDAGFNRFSVSIHSHLAEVEDPLTQRPGGHAEKIEGLKNLIRRFNDGAFQDRVPINMIMHKQNIDNLDASVRFFSDIGITDMRLLIVRPEGHAREHSELLVPRLTGVREKLPSIIRIAHVRRLNVMMDPPPFCLFYDIPGFKKIMAKDYLDLVISDSPSSRERETFSWNEYRLTQKTKESSCRKCCFDKICEGVWTGYVEIFGFDEFVPVTNEMLSVISL